MPETKRVELTWQGGLAFAGGEPDGPATFIDGDNAQAPSPMLALLLAAGACSGADVVSILERMRVGLEECRIEIAGVRRETEPRRYGSLHFVFHLRGTGLGEAQARRAIDLSLQKYCSVVHSLAPDIALTYELRLA